MAGFQLTEWIARSAQDVFDFLTDPANAPQVITSTTSMVKVSDGPTGVGTRLRETRLMRGKEEQADLEIVAYEPSRRYAVKNVSDGIETVYAYAFREEAGGTRVDLACEVIGKGAKKLLLPIVVSELKKEDVDHLQRLKAVLER